MMYYVLQKWLLELNMYRGGVITHNFPLKVNYRMKCVDQLRLSLPEREYLQHLDSRVICH